eukprot:968598_1
MASHSSSEYANDHLLRLQRCFVNCKSQAFEQYSDGSAQIICKLKHRSIPTESPLNTIINKQANASNSYYLHDHCDYVFNHMDLCVTLSVSRMCIKHLRTVQSYHIGTYTWEQIGRA